jgi:4-amino-4-deoxy-L-arabinose transferase-like glycosyltransferase
MANQAHASGAGSISGRGIYPPFWLVLSCLLLFFSFLGKSPVYILDEVKNAQCAREMMEQDEWIVPTFNGQLRVAKPPAHYYFIRAGYGIWGIGALGARFFSAVAGLLLIISTYLFVARFSSRRHALFTSLVLLSSTHLIFEYRLAVPDPYLILFNVLTLYGAYGWMSTGQRSWLWLAAVCTGLGVLTKGPVSILLPGLAVLLWTGWENRWKQLFRWELVPALIIVLLVAAPWYLLVDRATDGAWTRGFFINNNLNRFSAPMEGHGGPFFLVALFILLGLLPASVTIAEPFRQPRALLRTPIARFAVVVSIVFLVFYSVSRTKLPNYPMPMYPFLAFLLGSWLSEAARSTGKRIRYAFAILALLTLAMPAAAWIALSKEPGVAGYRYISLWLLILPAGVITGWYLLLKKGAQTAFAVTGITYAVFHLVFFAYIYPTVYGQNPVDKSMYLVKNDAPLLAYKAFNPAFLFRRNDPIPECTDPVDLSRRLDASPGATVVSRAIYETELRQLGLETVWKGRDLFEHHTTILMQKPHARPNQ